ncbi:MAG: hypothetical protein HYW85_05625 [Deltaproteobacteria bacterium]|nr:hypothetical protein [Deltaproteobacteria bacterium]MBI3017272.1 hypothetical protein [Deltaproteobacteria bacterium]
MTSKKTLEWQEQQREFIEEWKKKMSELHLRSFAERWDSDKLEMEILQLIDDQELRNIFRFAKNYIYDHKSGHFRKFMSDVYEEIKQYGTMNPYKIIFLNKKIDVARRKMK